MRESGICVGVALLLAHPRAQMPQKIVALSFVDLELATPAEFLGVERPVEQDE